MLRSIKELKGYTILATDGEIGQVHDFYFDNKTWTIRYLVVDTGAWLENRRVLLSPTILHPPSSIFYPPSSLCLFLGLSFLSLNLW